MKWNWGTWIFISSAVFMLMIIVFVFFMYRQNFDLVEDDYYPKALEYQQKIDKEENTRLLVERVVLKTINPDTVELTFPSFFEPDAISGTVYFYRPSAETGDVKVEIRTDTAGRMKISTEKLYTGKYLVKIDYTYMSKGYYQEEPLFIP